MYTYIYAYICILKTLRVTAVSTGDGMVFDQQETIENGRFTFLGGTQAMSLCIVRCPQRPQ